MKTVIIRKQWSVPHDARYGAPAGVDEMFAEITSQSINGREYLNETVWCNNVITRVSQYPAGTEYAATRLSVYA